MKQNTFLLLLTICFLTACNSNHHSRLAPPEPDIADRLKYQKGEIDGLFESGRTNIETLVKLEGQDALLPFKDSVLPEETETSFQILRDSLKHIVAITESPYSQSGDWFLTLTHYFDKNGQTFAFERQHNFFNSGCTEGVAYETRTEFYDDEFRLVTSDYKLTDQEGKALNKDSCVLMYDDGYTVLPGLDKYLRKNNIKSHR